MALGSGPTATSPQSAVKELAGQENTTPVAGPAPKRSADGGPGEPTSAESDDPVTKDHDEKEHDKKDHDESEQPEAAVMRELDSVLLADGSEIRGRITDVSEGAYVTVITEQGPLSIPWSRAQRVRFHRDGDDEAIVLDLSRPGFEPELTPSVETPYIEIQTRDGRPVSLLRLRRSTAGVQERYSTGYDEVCRAPCDRAIEAGSRRFFVDLNPWTASKIFELPPADHVQILVRPGRVRLRKAAVGTMIGGGVGLLAGIVALAVPTKGFALRNAGITVTVFSAFAVPIGGIMHALSRAKATAVPMTARPTKKTARRVP